MRAFAAMLVAILALAVLPAPPAAAQEDPSGTSYITPFPEGDIYKIQLYGDAFAEGLLSGLTESFSDDSRVQLFRRHRALTGIARADFDDELKIEDGPGRDTVHIGIVMIGIGDRIQIRTSPRDRLVLGSPEWREEYGRRVDRFIKALKKRSIALYWVSQPVMRRYEANDPAQTMNDIVREKAYLNGIKYIDIQAQFADEAGNYTPYGPDIAGKQRLLRESDGVTFTFAGNRKLAHFVEQEIKRDLNQAKNERAIPLAGSETEQKRIVALKPRTPAPADAGWKGTVSIAKDGKAPPKTAAAPAAAQSPELGGEQRADNSRITLKSVGASGREESVTVEILRPAIPSAVVALVTRRDTGERASQMGDVIADDVGGGLVVLSSITPGATGPGGTARRALAPSQTPYYQVLFKGERPAPKPGRADDFSWPRVEPDIAIEPSPAPRRLPRQPPARTPPRG